MKVFQKTDVTTVLPRPRSRGIGPAGYYYCYQLSYGKGLYCKNYKEIVERQIQENTGKVR